ncbi:MAG: type IV toxin-antitoxin system AbiEi family antitoxin domain-containing protein, partial [Nocardioides sp.]
MKSDPSWLPGLGRPLDARCPLPGSTPFSRDQARALGVDRVLLNRLIEHGSVRRVVHGVFVSTSAPDTVETRA